MCTFFWHVCRWVIDGEEILIEAGRLQIDNECENEKTPCLFLEGREDAENIYQDCERFHPSSSRIALLADYEKLESPLLNPDSRQRSSQVIFHDVIADMSCLDKLTALNFYTKLRREDWYPGQEELPLAQAVARQEVRWATEFHYRTYFSGYAFVQSQASQEAGHTAVPLDQYIVRRLVDRGNGWKQPPFRALRPDYPASSTLARRVEGQEIPFFDQGHPPAGRNWLEEIQATASAAQYSAQEDIDLASEAGASEGPPVYLSRPGNAP